MTILGSMGDKLRVPATIEKEVLLSKGTVKQITAHTLRELLSDRSATGVNKDGKLYRTEKYHTYMDIKLGEATDLDRSILHVLDNL